jgi:hypothetical protein
MTPDRRAWIEHLAREAERDRASHSIKNLDGDLMEWSETPFWVQDAAPVIRELLAEIDRLRTALQKIDRIADDPEVSALQAYDEDGAARLMICKMCDIARNALNSVTPPLATPAAPTPAPADRG